jgi:hypothetical protein
MPVWRLWVVVALVSIGLVRPSAALAAAPMLDWPVPGGHFYTQANGFPLGSSPMGYAILDDNAARFWTGFQRLGGTDRLGYPVSQRFAWQGFLSQATQKAVLQWRPDTGTVVLVNVFDDLGRIGLNAWLRTVRSVPEPLPASADAGLTWPEIVQHRTALLRARPALIAYYQSVPGALDLFGLPSSAVVDAGPMYVVRLQRAVLQEWKVAEPWARVGQVTIANGGDLAKESGALPWREVRPTAPPPGTWTAHPGDYAIAGQATWYDVGYAGKPMANGQIYDPRDPTTTASNAFPLGSLVQVTAPKTGKTIQVYVRDTGKFAYPDVVDLSPAAFTALGTPTSAGIQSVSVVLVAPPPVSTSSKTQAPPAP